MEAIKDLIDIGYTIKWVGYHSPMHIWVHMVTQHTEKKLVIQLQKDYTKDSFRSIHSSSATEPGSNTGTIWSSDSRLELLRLASILGINIGGSCTPGCGQRPNAALGCVMAYDIESDRSRIPSSSFGSLSESIISIAVYCSCGANRVFSFIPNVDFDYVLCKNSMDTVSKLFDYVKNHSPQWLIGYNNFGYDNTRIAYHSDDDLDSILIPMRIGSGSSLTYAFYIDIQGVYNADLLTYFEKTRRAQYPNMRLATLAEYHDIERKMEFDTADVSDFKKLFEYNLHDSKITVQLALKTGVLAEIASFCTVACVPVIDSVRFVTGTFAACSIASYCLQNEICMDWSPCIQVQDYRGAEVLKPIIGLHEDVVSCDFSSMYPTILLGANISIENCTTTKSRQLEGSTWKSSTGSSFVINNKRIMFDNSFNVVIPPVMKLFVEKRRQVKKSDPVLSFALKIVANSIYGSLGDANSRIYSPMCSAAITTGGRWCLALAETIFKIYGFKVVYGDTDSCYVVSTDYAKCSLEEVVRIMSQIFLYTPFPGMSMEIENRFSKIAFLGKKTYFGKSINGNVVSKGMSKSRKDRIGVCRTLASNVVDIILSPICIADSRVIIGNMVSCIINLVVLKQLKLSDVSKYVKKGGSNYFEYMSVLNKREALECETFTGNETVEYSSGEVCSLICREMRVLLNIASIGSLKTVIQQSSVL